MKQERSHAEAAAMSRYLVGTLAAVELLDRYAQADGLLFAAPPEPRDARLLAFVRAHPRTIGPLDAASALLRRDSRLRKKVLVMAAILETSPRFAEHFLARESGRLSLLAGLLLGSALAVLRVGLGLLLLPVAERSRA